MLKLLLKDLSIQRRRHTCSKIKEIFYQVSEKHLKGKYVNWNDYKLEVRDEVSKFLYNETKEDLLQFRHNLHRKKLNHIMECGFC